jgi:hypothetical protein
VFCFVLLPAVLLPLGVWAAFSELCNSVLADLLTNLHTSGAGAARDAYTPGAGACCVAPDAPEPQCRVAEGSTAHR